MQILLQSEVELEEAIKVKVRLPSAMFQETKTKEQIVSLLGAMQHKAHKAHKQLLLVLQQAKMVKEPIPLPLVLLQVNQAKHLIV